MSIDRDDPRLTAFALGELEDAAFEAELRNDAAAMAEVDAIRAMASRVTEELGEERADGLTTTQRERVLKRRSLFWLLPASAAAVLLVALIAASTERGQRIQASKPVAQLKQPPALDHEKDPAFYQGPQGNRERQDDRSQKELRNKISPQTKGKRGLGNGAGGGPRGEAKKVVRHAEDSRDVIGLGAGDAGGPPTPNDAPPPGNRAPTDPEPPPAPPSTPGGSPRVVHHARVPNAKAVKLLEQGARPRKESGWRSRSITTQPPGSEGYGRLVDNPFALGKETSTFSIDVDTASLANVRRFLKQGRLPPKDAVRIEELINYFDYRYAPPAKDAAHPFRVHVAIAGCPWNAKHRLARIAIKGKVIEHGARPKTNLVFLIDVSGSMQPRNKLPLLVKGMHLLVNQLDARDRVAIVTYAGSAGLRLASTPGNDKDRIRAVLNGLASGGSTNGAGGIRLAYEIARKHFVRGGANRVILATDGDFNVGVSDTGGLTRLIEREAKSGVFLSVLGFGQGNYKDDKMEELSNRGNGNYTYIDSMAQAKRALVDQMTGTLITIAKDVKIQVFFNPKRVAAYRLIGYANRMLKAQDFNDDTKDAGEIGAGHAVTALYEIVPVGVATPVPTTDDNPFVAKAAVKGVDSEALFRLRLRYKTPAGAKSRLMEADIRDGGSGFDKADADFRWAAAIAAFGMQLRDSKHRGRITWQGIREIAGSAVDDHKDRRESLPLLDIAMAKHGVKPPAKLVKRPKTPVQVQSVRGNVVAINMTGAKVGDTFRIERGAITLGTVTVTHVHADKVVGEFKGSGVPQAGDAAVQQ